MNDETTDLNVALGIAIEQRNAAQNEIIRMAMTIGQLTRRITALEKAAKDAEIDEQRAVKIADEARKSNGSAEQIAP